MMYNTSYVIRKNGDLRFIDRIEYWSVGDGIVNKSVYTNLNRCWHSSEVIKTAIATIYCTGRTFLCKCVYALRSRARKKAVL